MSHMFLFQPPGRFEGALLVAATPDMVPKGTKFDPKKLLDDAQAGGLRNMRGTLVESKDP